MNREDVDKILDDYLSDYHKNVVKCYIDGTKQKIIKYIEENKENTTQTLDFKNFKSYNTALLELLELIQGSDKE